MALRWPLLHTTCPEILSDRGVPSGEETGHERAVGEYVATALSWPASSPEILSDRGVPSGEETGHERAVATYSPTVKVVPAQKSIPELLILMVCPSRIGRAHV